ncbi:hypothetical protein PENTCL1PPCAC_8847, partial [Pristionchus entomophagus]
QIHQPSMKVFTVGMGDEKGVKLDAPEKVDVEKAGPVPVPPSPILISAPAPVKHRRSFKGLFTCFGLLIFALVVAITISEIAYHRQRDEAFFRLKWAELKQRMLGYDLMRAQMQQQAQQQALESSRLQAAAALPLLQHGDDAQDERPAVVDERLAFSNRLRNGDRAEQTTTEAAPTSSEQEDSPVDVRFAFLRAILDKLRERAAAAGMDGKMHVSLIEVRRPSPQEFNNEHDNSNNNVEDLSPDSQAFQDGFGEVAAPHPLTGHFRIGGVRQNIDEQERMPASDFFGPRWEHPSRFLPEPVRPWNSIPRGGSDGDSAFFPRPWEQPSSEDEEDRQPHMRVTHHFDRESGGPAPSRVVTELFGAAGRRALDNMLIRGAPMMQLQQEPQRPMGMDSPGSSFPRWEANIDDLPRPWLQNQVPALMMMTPGMGPQQPDFMQQQPQFPPMMQQAQPMWSMPQVGGAMNGPYMGPGNFWNIPPVQPAQQPQPPAFPMQQQQQNDDFVANTQMGSRLGANIGERFRDQEMDRPRLPFGTQELPQNDVVDVHPVQGGNTDNQGLQQLPWYVPRGFEHERPAWASEDKTQTANDVPMIFPHPTAAERPIDAPPTVEATNKPSIANIKATQTDSSFLHDGEVAPPARWTAGSWQHTQPEAAAAAPEAVEPANDTPRHRLPERDTFDDIPPRPTHDDPSGPANDDMDPSRVLFQVDEPHLTP